MIKFKADKNDIQLEVKGMGIVVAGEIGMLLNTMYENDMINMYMFASIVGSMAAEQEEFDMDEFISALEKIKEVL